MSDERPDSPAKKPPGPGWVEELRERLVEWIRPLVNPPVPVPVPVRRY